jgi:hypothetical protein
VITVTCFVATIMLIINEELQKRSEISYSDVLATADRFMVYLQESSNNIEMLTAPIMLGPSVTPYSFVDHHHHLGGTCRPTLHGGIRFSLNVGPIYHTTQRHNTKDSIIINLLTPGRSRATRKVVTPTRNPK